MYDYLEEFLKSIKTIIRRKGNNGIEKEAQNPIVEDAYYYEYLPVFSGFDIHQADRSKSLGLGIPYLYGRTASEAAHIFFNIPAGGMFPGPTPFITISDTNFNYRIFNRFRDYLYYHERFPFFHAATHLQHKFYGDDKFFRYWGLSPLFLSSPTASSLPYFSFSDEHPGQILIPFINNETLDRAKNPYNVEITSPLSNVIYLLGQVDKPKLDTAIVYSYLNRPNYSLLLAAINNHHGEHMLNPEREIAMGIVDTILLQGKPVHAAITKIKNLSSSLTYRIARTVVPKRILDGAIKYGTAFGNRVSKFGRTFGGQVTNEMINLWLWGLGLGMTERIIDNAVNYYKHDKGNHISLDDYAVFRSLALDILRIAEHPDSKRIALPAIMSSILQSFAISTNAESFLAENNDKIAGRTIHFSPFLIIGGEDFNNFMLKLKNRINELKKTNKYKNREEAFEDAFDESFIEEFSKNLSERLAIISSGIHFYGKNSIEMRNYNIRLNYFMYGYLKELLGEESFNKNSVLGGLEHDSPFLTARLLGITLDEIEKVKKEMLSLQKFSDKNEDISNKERELMIKLLNLEKGRAALINGLFTQYKLSKYYGMSQSINFSPNPNNKDIREDIKFYNNLQQTIDQTFLDQYNKGRINDQSVKLLITLLRSFGIKFKKEGEEGGEEGVEYVEDFNYSIDGVKNTIKTYLLKNKNIFFDLLDEYFNQNSAYGYSSNFVTLFFPTLFHSIFDSPDKLGAQIKGNRILYSSLVERAKEVLTDEEREGIFFSSDRLPNEEIDLEMFGIAERILNGKSLVLEFNPNQKSSRKINNPQEMLFKLMYNNGLYTSPVIFHFGREINGKYVSVGEIVFIPSSYAKNSDFLLAAPSHVDKKFLDAFQILSFNFSTNIKSVMKEFNISSPYDLYVAAGQNLADAAIVNYRMNLEKEMLRSLIGEGDFSVKIENTKDGGRKYLSKRSAILSVNNYLLDLPEFFDEKVEFIKNMLVEMDYGKEFRRFVDKEVKEGFVFKSADTNLDLLNRLKKLREFDSFASYLVGLKKLPKTENYENEIKFIKEKIRTFSLEEVLDVGIEQIKEDVKFLNILYKELHEGAGEEKLTVEKIIELINERQKSINGKNLTERDIKFLRAYFDPKNNFYRKYLTALTFENNNEDQPFINSGDLIWMRNYYLTQANFILINKFEGNREEMLNKFINFMSDKTSKVIIQAAISNPDFDINNFMPNYSNRSGVLRKISSNPIHIYIY